MINRKNDWLKHNNNNNNNNNNDYTTTKQMVATFFHPVCGSPPTTGYETPSHEEDDSRPNRPTESRGQQKGQETLLFLCVMEVLGRLGTFFLQTQQEGI
jgi:hypothetical protein